MTTARSADHSPHIQSLAGGEHAGHEARADAMTGRHAQAATITPGTRSHPMTPPTTPPKNASHRREREQAASDIADQTRHRLHPRRARGRGPRPPVHGSGRAGGSVPAGAGAADRAQADRGGARGRRGLHGRRLCARQRPLRRRARHRRAGRVQHGDRGRRRQNRRLAGAGHDRRGAARHGRPRLLPGRQPGHARRHRRHAAADAAVEGGRDREEPQSLVPSCAHRHVGAAARPGAPLADARRAGRRDERRLRQGLRPVQRRRAVERCLGRHRAGLRSPTPRRAASVSPSSPAPASSTTRLPRASRRWRSAGGSRSPPRCGPRACFPRTMRCRSACSVMPARARPRRPFSTARSTA